MDIDAEIRAEADALLSSGLHDLFARYGTVHVVGSYALGLMTWRDLDIHIVQAALDRPAWFDLGAALAAHLEPHRMHYRDERTAATPGLPRGLYGGVYMGDERRGAWKIDIWATDANAFEPARRHAERLASRLTDASRQAIIAIKSASWREPEYRRAFSSGDIYEAVLDHGVTDVEGFRVWRERSRRG